MKQLGNLAVKWSAVQFVLLLGCFDAQSADTPPPAAPNAPDLPWYDDGQLYVTDRLQAVAIWLDDFFADPRIETQKHASARLSVLFNAFYSGVENADHDGVRFRGGADLPHFDERLRLLITSDAESAMTGRDLAGTAQDEIKETEGSVGLGYLVSRRPKSKFRVSGSLSGGLTPEVRFTARHIYTQPWTATTTSHLTSTLYWRSEDGSGMSTLFDYEWVADPNTLWRYTLFGNYGEQTEVIDWSSQVLWARRLNDQEAIQVRGGIQGVDKPDAVINEGWLKFGYRRNLWRSWLFFEVEPGLSWAIQEEYAVEPTIALRLEVHFRR